MMKVLFNIVCVLGWLFPGFAVSASLEAPAKQPFLVSFEQTAGSFPLVKNGQAAVFYTDNKDNAGVQRALNDLRSDIKLVTGISPAGTTGKLEGKYLVIAGIIGSHAVIDGLILQKKLTVDGVAGTWENHVIQVVNKPFPGVESALVIAGSDKRGAIYGIYSISENMGVSPWYWWADVPVTPRKNVFVNRGLFSQGSPAVKYRGIFLNDEAPALSGWTADKFGGFKHGFYEKVFELILRLKGNYLWPAMWGNAFYDDDPENAVLADRYGVVIGTSHHEPLMRAHDEWRRYGKGGAWNYSTNASSLQEFWKEGIRRMGTKESIVSVGMRGDGDEPMSEKSNIALLEKIVNDQREIIRSQTGRDPAEIPQLWALYKEVQEYYDKGMRVPDDITLLLCDDNWGNIRKLPALGAPERKGGYGIYYHFDYVGGPRNYKWINTNPLARVWEQMHLAYEYKARQIWIVNVGDLKPMEFPISFFLDYAWDPGKLPAEKLQDYTNRWAAQQFGKQYAAEIGRIISAYGTYNGRRKPELLDQQTYSLTHYREFEQVTNDYLALKKQAETIGEKLDKPYRDAYYQLVMHPVAASANLYALYFAVAKNRLYAQQQRVAANREADLARKFYVRDAEISRYYNDTLANGKWKHLMDQTHIGYTYWQQPAENKIPELKAVQPVNGSQMGVALEGSAEVWPSSAQKPALPEFNRYSNKKYYVDIFNQGTEKFAYTAEAAQPWVKVSTAAGTVDQETRLWISIDWKKVPPGDHTVPLTIQGPRQTKVTVAVNIQDPGAGLKGFIPDEGVIAIEAAHFTAKKGSGTISWQILPGLGRTLSGVTPLPATVKAQTPGEIGCPVLEYQVNILQAGKVKVAAYLSPSLDFQNSGGLRYAVSIDDEKPQLVNMNQDPSEATWNRTVADNINKQYTLHQVMVLGKHTLKIWMVDPGVVLQKLVISPESFVDRSYLGPPESTRVK